MAGFIKLLFTAFAYSITSFLYIFMILMVYLHIKARAQLEETWLGFLRGTMRDRLLNAMLYGMITGLAASTLIAVAGIPIDLNTILVIWPLALLLTLLDFRYLCFSYAGGLLSLISLIFGWPDIQVPAVIALIGILHLIESVLIVLDGHRDALPVVMEHKRFKPVGGFVMNKLWPVPLVILTMPTQLLPASGGTVAMPDWWPVFGMRGEGGLLLFPMAVILEYSGLATTGVPKQRTRATGFWLAAYSLFILGLASLSIKVPWLQYSGAVLMPLLHELILHGSWKSQLKGKPVFGAPWRGIRILDVYPDYMGSRMGLKSGDIVMNVNGQAVNSEEMLRETLNKASTYVWIDVKRAGKMQTVECRNYKDEDQLGVLFVPRKASRLFLPTEQNGLAFTLWKRLAQRRQ
ncbi:MAG TPA: PDZ domain-containing protein [Clostridiales bacterium]|jgi:hypothetical protein|nr:PDZ domain-containing protein [Clostridiales bacterium]